MKTPYETMFLLPPNLGQDEVAAFIDRLQEVVEKKQGEVTNVNKMGVRKTAYAVNKVNSAYYVLLQYRGTGETIYELERILKNSDEVLKYLSTKITTKPVVPTSKVKAEQAVEAAITEVEVDTAAPEVTTTDSADAEVKAKASAVENGAQE
ncbi:30S ribosomal protein S6 [bacterium]|nr:30S ribosomal protein S6 [bacterium]